MGCGGGGCRVKLRDEWGDLIAPILTRWLNAGTLNATMRNVAPYTAPLLTWLQPFTQFESGLEVRFQIQRFCTVLTSLFEIFVAFKGCC